MNIDLRHHSIKVDIKIVTSTNIDSREKSIMIYLSIVLHYHRLLSEKTALFGRNSTLTRCCLCGIIELFSRDQYDAVLLRCPNTVFKRPCRYFQSL